MDVSVRTDSGSLGSLAGEWRALWERDTAATPFQTPEYTGIWLTEFGSDRSPHFIEIRDDGSLVGLAALSIDADGVLRFLGDAALTDYFGPLSAPDDRDRVATAMMDATRELEWTEAEFLGLSADGGWAEPIARAAKAADLRVEESQQDVCPRISLTGSYEDYLASLDGKLRHEIKRKARKLEREAGSFTVRIVHDAEVHHDMEHFFDMYRASAGPKGHFAHWGLSGFFIVLSRTFAKCDWLRLGLLELGNKPIAGVFAWSARGEWSIYNAAFDQGYRELAPGMVLMGEMIRLATEEGAHTFDLMRGDEPYKYRFGAVDVPLTKLTVRRG